MVNGARGGLSPKANIQRGSSRVNMTVSAVLVLNFARVVTRRLEDDAAAYQRFEAYEGGVGHGFACSATPKTARARFRLSGVRRNR